INIISIMLLLGGCSSPPVRAPVVDAAPIPNYRIQRHVVAPGETLYSIAWRYDMDYQHLSKINGLGEGHRIRPGQVLALSGSSAVRPPAAPSPTTPPFKAPSKVSKTLPEAAPVATKEVDPRLEKQSSP